MRGGPDPDGPGEALVWPPNVPGEALAPRVSVLDDRPELAADVQRFVEGSRAKATRRAHEGDWALWQSWCARQGVASLPGTPETAAAFLAALVRGDPPEPPRALASVLRYAATVGKAHKVQGYPSPFADAKVQAMVTGMRRELRDAPTAAKAAMTVERLEACLPPGDTAQELRDRALLLLGHATASRRSELCELLLGDLEFDERTLQVHIRHSKTDQTGKGLYKLVPRVGGPTCPVEALEAWLALLPAGPGPVFRGLRRNQTPKDTPLSAGEVGKIVKRAAERGGLDPDVFGGHSLRAGYVTDAINAGQSVGDIMPQTGHAKAETLLRYNRGGVDPRRAQKVAEVLRRGR